MNRQPNITTATKEAFVSAFFQLAQEKNIHQITIHEITDLAGYNRTTFYRYFEDVYALIEYAEDCFFQSTRKTLEEDSEGHAMNRHFFETFIHCIQESRARISILMSEQNLSHFIRRMQENLTEDIRSQVADTPKKEFITNMFFSGVFSAVAAHLQNTELLSEEDLLDIIQKLFTDWYWPQMEGTKELISPAVPAGF
ncbi:MAG: TetR/AcrR family transcriptional regulator [Lachnospiraceae bacterium]|nr:TetR/AcrR family transcriptional regulator [Lachnospiraceae bacterium]